jgi:hypothetical protein
MNTTVTSFNNLPQIYQECIIKISKDKTVVDLACADGWAGKIALECGAKSVTFADARLERFVQPNDYTNYQQQFIDLNYPESLCPLLLGADVILYFGHLYHCTNHEEILDALVNSDCKEFFIDTKVGLGNSHIDSDIPTILRQIPESVSDPYNGWHSTDLYITPGAPNLSWMMDYFNRKKLEVKFQKSVDNVYKCPEQDPYYHRIYLFHVVKSNIT